MALQFVRFSEGLALYVTDGIWFGIAIACDFESHDDITVETSLSEYFCLSLWVNNKFMWTSGNLYHVVFWKF